MVTWTNSNGGSGTASGTVNWNVLSIPLLVGTNTIRSKPRMSMALLPGVQLS